MSGDAIVILHPTEPELLKPFLDLDDESESDDGIYAEELDDGTFLLHTFQPFELFVENPAEAAQWLAQLGDALPLLHDDARGFFFYPDSVEPEATTYDALIAELATEGAFFAPEPEEEDLDLEALGDLASQLLGGQTPNGSFEIGQLFTNMQQQIADALGVQTADGKPALVDAEFEEDSKPSPKRDDEPS